MHIWRGRNIQPISFHNIRNQLINDKVGIFTVKQIVAVHSHSAHSAVRHGKISGLYANGNTVWSLALICELEHGIDVRIILTVMLYQKCELIKAFFGDGYCEIKPYIGLEFFSYKTSLDAF